MSVATNIVRLRERLGLNQKELAEGLSMNRSVLNRIENGTRPVRDDELAAFADYFNVSADYLLGRDKIPTPVLTEEETKVLGIFDMLNTEGRKLVMTLMKSVKLSHSKEKSKTERIIQNNRGGSNYGVVGGNFSANVTIG